MSTKAIVCAAAICAAIGTGATAATVSQTQNQTVAGENLLYVFGGLGPSDGMGGTLTIEGTDLDIGQFDDEYMDVSIEGTSFGRWVCTESTSTVGTDIPGWFNNVSECRFTLVLPVAGTDLDGFLADGTVSVLLDLGPATDFNLQTASAKVTLSYTDAPAMGVIPLPATGLLIIGGLAGLGVLRRRR